MSFDDELKFEEAVVRELVSKGWKNGILSQPTEKDLLRNWANILLQNNMQIDRLNGIPLTETEMQQIIEQITRLRTPLKLNEFINGRTISIRRDNEQDKEHFGKEVSLKIYDRDEVAGGQSVYQIAEQPIFNKKNELQNSRRGDLMLLINGMPVIHIELKKSNIPVSQACNQIAKYSYEGVFQGIYSLVQVFVAMTPDETLYFANPGPDGKFNSDFYFHWEDFNNEIINDWNKVIEDLLNIPMAHQLIGFYTVADHTDDILKVMRSYQYYAANAISDKVAKADWNENNTKSGYVWHTTGSGKTMTSFKSAQLIANSKDADKVIFLVDRIELGTQSLREYRGFADSSEEVQATEDTSELISKLKSNNTSDTLIVTSIQKMSRIKADLEDKLDDVNKINKKKLVFIVDECHRGQFGEMHQAIVETFPKAKLFGFTGTPIFDENKKNESNTADLFGNELHRYSIADGIRDKNVLGFDIYKVLTFKDNKIREAVALDKAKAKSVEDAIENPEKSRIYYEYINKPMAGYEDENGNYIPGIEDYLQMKQYKTKEHHNCVVENILENWATISHNNKFSGLLATSSIQEAIEYYRIIKNRNTDLKVSVLVDPTIDNNDDFKFKEDGMIEIIDDYNKMFKQNYTLSTSNLFKKDIELRLAHKKPYSMLAKEEQINLLIVVDQLLTGFDSKWINVLYLDKVLKYEGIIQAFSRTNRICDQDKPFGIIKYYRKPYTMENYINKAIKLYSGDKELGVLVPKLNENIEKMMKKYGEIKQLFQSYGIENFSRLPDDKEARKKFASDFNEFHKLTMSARIQGYRFQNGENEKNDENEALDETLNAEKVAEDKEPYIYENEKITEEEFETLKARYKELSQSRENLENEAPYDLQGYITELDPIKINNDYMNSKFKKYLKALRQTNISAEELNFRLNELHKSFASLSQEKQKYANVLIHDIQSGNISIDENKTFMDYITEYIKNAENDSIKNISNALGINESKLRILVESNVDESNINEFGRFDDLKNTLDVSKAKKFFEEKEHREIPLFEVYIKTDKLLRDFILNRK